VQLIFHWHYSFFDRILDTFYFDWYDSIYPRIIVFGCAILCVIIHTRWSLYCGCFSPQLGLCGCCYYIIRFFVKIKNAFQFLCCGVASEVSQETFSLSSSVEEGSQETFSQPRSVKETKTNDKKQIFLWNSVEFAKIEDVVIVEDI